jgi:predicted lipoprotein with Yx(FWY)xxD motif
MSQLRTSRARRPLMTILLLTATSALAAACGGETPTSTGASPSTAAPTTAAATTASPMGPATVHTADSKLGRILVDGQGRTLYGFTRDTAGTPTCTGGCLNAWPPLTVESGTLPAGLDPAVFSLVAGAEGQQLKAGAWPLYLYAGDSAAGDTKGQGSGGVWFVVDPRGELIRTTPPTTQPSAGY